MRIIVTGGAGFIGSVLVRYLINIGNHEVLNIDCITYAGNPNSLKDIEENNRYKFTQTNINDRDAIQRLFADYEPDAVIHTAAESHVDRSINGPSEFINTNIIGTFNLLDVSKEYWGNLPNVKKNNFRFLHMSTDEVFGDLDLDDDPFVETTPYEPSSPYSASKASSDHLVRAWFRTYGLPTIITNCSNNYGPFQFPEKLVPLIITNIMQGKSLPIYGSGKQIRDWLYVEDHARAIELVLKKGKIGNSYNIGGCNEIQNIEVVKMICNHFEELAPAKPKGINKYQDLIVHIDDRPGHDKRYAMNIDKIASELNWAPEESFETGIRKTIEWYLDNKNWWKMILDGSYKMIDSKGVIKS